VHCGGDLLLPRFATLADHGASAGSWRWCRGPGGVGPGGSGPGCSCGARRGLDPFRRRRFNDGGPFRLDGNEIERAQAQDQVAVLAALVGLVVAEPAGSQAQSQATQPGAA
jgi:hypothetical protein